MAADPTPSKAPATTARPWLPPLLTGVAIIGITVLMLHLEGRVWFCKCGEIKVYAPDVWTSHCSQHFSDPYSFSHLLHGVFFFWFFAWLLPRVRVGWRACMAMGAAAAWEIAENSHFVIDRYRSVTMSLDYLGDSVVNATADVLCCAAGFFIARWLGWWKSVALFVAIELIMLFTMRDNLTLNVIMLVYPIKAIKAWQTEGHV